MSIELKVRDDPYVWPNLPEASRECVNGSARLKITAKYGHHFTPDDYLFSVKFYYDDGRSVIPAPYYLRSDCWLLETRVYAKEKIPEYIKDPELVRQAVAFIDELPEPWPWWTDGTFSRESGWYHD